MTKRTFTVQFATTSAGPDGKSGVLAMLVAAFGAHGAHLPKRELESEQYQVRDLVLVGQVLQGTFARLRPDAPHVVDDADVEHPLELEPGDSVVDKCHFILRKQPNLLIWQVRKEAGGLAKFAAYLSSLFDLVVTLPPVVNTDRLKRILEGDVYELQFSYARPPVAHGAPDWSHHAFDLMQDVHAAKGRFRLTAPRHGQLGRNAKDLLRRLMGAPGVEKLKVRLTDESNLLDIVTTPVKEHITVELVGKYPLPRHVFEELEAAYARQRDDIARWAGLD